MARIFSIRPGITLKGRSFKGVRGWAGKPAHPPLTDFPIVSFALVAVFDVISYLARYGDKPGLAREAFVAGTWVIVAGGLVSLAAVVTGFWDWWKGIERDESSGWLGRAKHTQVWRTINWHATVMVLATAVAAADIVLRLAQHEEPAAPLPVMVLSIFAGALVSYGAAYGGSLVYDYQFNVESLDGSTAWDETEADQLPGDKPPSSW